MHSNELKGLATDSCLGLSKVSETGNTIRRGGAFGVADDPKIAENSRKIAPPFSHTSITPRGNLVGYGVGLHFLLFFEGKASLHTSDNVGGVGGEGLKVQGFVPNTKLKDFAGMPLPNKRIKR